MTDPAVLTHFDEYHIYINSKKCRAIRKTKETFPFKGVVKEVKEKKKRITKKKDVVLDSEGNEIVAEEKKRNNKKKEEVNVEVGSDVEVPPVVEKKKRNNKHSNILIIPTQSTLCCRSIALLKFNNQIQVNWRPNLTKNGLD